MGLLCFSIQCFATTNFITIKDSAYAPSKLAIDTGDTVTWKQDDNTEHSVTSEDFRLNSGTIVPGESFSFAFNEAGTYNYFCTFHGAGNMSGVIVVSEPSPNELPARPSNMLPVDNATNQPVLVRLAANSFSDTDENDFHGASQWLIRYAKNNEVAVDSGPVTGNSLTNYSPAGLIEGVSYDWQVRFKDGRGAWSTYSNPTRFTTLISPPPKGVGLRANYHNLLDFNSPLAVVTNATINFNWGKSRPARQITADNFSVRWEGLLLPQFTELYQIEFQFRGRARVWVNNTVLIDEWMDCSFSQARRVAVPLIAGQLTPVRIEYTADPSGALAILRWGSLNVSMDVIPMSRLFPPPSEPSSVAIP